MSKFYTLMIKSIYNIKSSLFSSINYLGKFFNDKKTIDSMYKDILENKTSKINTLNKRLKSIDQKTRKLDIEIHDIKHSIGTKENLIKSIQHFTSQRTNQI
ncbi:hypothetical protein KM800_14125 [Clostridium tyrobutyricum]|uniref:hypothetical protein n=1 Tax=Clostridium tyrobutyricum TaxID=1519 RepID=UPI001C380F0F|nr:hypothetical protein [Clostridium tyrobutyricum]MBV4420444.1 hypothetical protein [Clostridium tyrobutyricum]